MRAIYPGSFDPLTNGHLDIIERCSKKFEHVIVAVLNNPSKKGIFTLDERMNLIRESIMGLENVEIETFSGLLIDYAKIKNSTVIIRGLRAVSDFEFEMQMALANKTLYPDIETFFMVSSNKFSYLSSSIVREVAFLNGDISFFVPKVVEVALKNKIKGGL